MGVVLSGLSGDGGDPRAVAEALPGAVFSGDPILITTSGPSGVPKTVVRGAAAVRASGSPTAGGTR